MASQEEAQMRGAVVAWGRARWPGCRVMHELQVGGCRVDLAFFTREHIAVVEIKSSRDVLDRLSRQLRNYRWAVPEVWIAFAPKWREHFENDDLDRHDFSTVGRIMVEAGTIIEDIPSTKSKYSFPHRACINEMMTAPMLHLLWVDELQGLCSHFGLRAKARDPRRTLMRLISRELTGQQIIEGVCGWLRARPCGWEADAPIAKGTA